MTRPARRRAAKSLPASGSTDTRRLISASIVLLVLVGCAFYPAFRSQFVHWDDYALVVENQWLNPPTAASLKHFWTAGHEGLYTPLAYTAWSFVAKLFPPMRGEPSSAAAFHVLNIVLHAGAVLGLLLLLFRLTRNVAASAVGAAIFAVHPIQTEPVVWISGMNNVLAGALSIGAIYCYVRFAQAEKNQRPLVWYGLASILFLLALFSKPTAVTVPVLVVLIDVLLLRRSVRSIALSIAPWVMMSIVFAIITRTVQPASTVTAPPLPFRFIVAADAMAFYLGKLFWPVNLCMDYSRTPGFLRGDSARYFTWIAPAVVLAIAIMFRRKLPPLLTGVLFAAAALLPVLGLTPFDFQNYSTVADRYMYLAMAGVAIALCGLLAKIPQRVATFAGTIVVITLALVTFVQATHWEDTRTLLARGIEVNPRSLMANRNLAALFLDANRLDDAQKFARQGVAMHPQSPDAHLNAAVVAAARQDLPTAIAHYEAANKLRPNHPATLYSLAGALAQSGQLDRALEYATLAVRLDPNDSQAHVNLGTVLAQRGDVDNAIIELRKGIRLAPNDVRAMTNLAVMLVTKQQQQEAVTLLRRAISIDPNFAPARGLLRELGVPN